jgi:hypothetical protein
MSESYLEDRAAIHDLFTRYCCALDNGEIEAACPIVFLSGGQFEAAFNGCIVPLVALRASIHAMARGSYACQNCLCDSLGA